MNSGGDTTKRSNSFGVWSVLGTPSCAKLVFGASALSLPALSTLSSWAVRVRCAYSSAQRSSTLRSASSSAFESPRRVKKPCLTAIVYFFVLTGAGRLELLGGEGALRVLLGAEVQHPAQRLLLIL